MHDYRLKNTCTKNTVMHLSMSSPRVEGQANHGNLTLRSVPRVGILNIIFVMFPGLGILTSRHLDLLIGEWREWGGPGNDLSWKIPRRHLIEFPAFVSEKWLNKR